MRVRIQGGAARFFRGIRPQALMQGLAQIAGKSGHNNSAFEASPDTEPLSAAKGAVLDPIDERFESAQGAGPPDSEATPMSDASVAFEDFDLFYNTVSNTGLVRKRNEDACGLFVPPDPHVLRTMGVLAVLADGMGGHENGDRASALVLESMGKSYYDSREGKPGDALVQAVEAAHAAILDDAARIGRDMGSTCSALLFHANAAYAAHVGDSRIYRWRDGNLEQLSADDSMVAEMVRRGMVTPENAKRHPDRSVLLNALGQSVQLTVSRASTPCQLEDGDRFLICSDGLHGLVDDWEIAEALAEPSSLAASNAKLVNRALDRGGNDNISIVLVRVRRNNP